MYVFGDFYIDLGEIIGVFYGMMWLGVLGNWFCDRCNEVDYLGKKKILLLLFSK